MLSLGFSKSKLKYNELRFRPVDVSKPIVFAASYESGFACYFFILDAHLSKEKSKGNGMLNYKPFKTNSYLIDCYDGSRVSAKPYWSITSEGITVVYGDVSFPDTWHLADCEMLCAFVGGAITVNQLRMHAYLIARVAVKEERREKHIEGLAFKNELLRYALKVSYKECDMLREKNLTLTCKCGLLIEKLESAIKSSWPLTWKSTIKKIIKQSPLTQ